jgi:hypothetical protein
MNCQAIANWIQQLEQARISLMSGQQVVVLVDAFRSRVEYNKGDLARLTQEIALKRAQYTACVRGCLRRPGDPRPDRVVMTRPLQFFF